MTDRFVLFTPDIERFPCGCEYWSADPAPGVWFPCEVAKANGWDFCLPMDAKEDSETRDLMDMMCEPDMDDVEWPDTPIPTTDLF